MPYTFFTDLGVSVVKQLSGIVYIKTKRDYDHNERRNYVLNYDDKSDWLNKQRRSCRKTHLLDFDLTRDVLRLEVQCGYQFIKHICEEHNIANRFELLLSYKIALWAEETIYNHIFMNSSNLDFFTYETAKKRLHSESAKKALLASATGKKIINSKFDYGRKLIRAAGIFPFCFLPRGSTVSTLPIPLKLLEAKCSHPPHM